MWKPGVALITLALPTLGQTEEILSIQRPAGLSSGWGSFTQAVHDLDGDGVPELAIGVAGHGGGNMGSVHSGATGALLFMLNVPNEPLFVGRRIQSVGDVDGDGTSDPVSLGGQSGDSNSPNGRIYVFSGADGGLMLTFSPPADQSIGTGFVSPGDVDGDGVDDLLVSAQLHGTVHWARWTLFSSATGAVLYSAARAGEDQGNFQHFPALLSDMNGDGVAEFALPAEIAGALFAEVRSGADGEVLELLPLPGAPLFTGNGEPFVGISDQDGDGLRDLAVGATFQGFLAVHSTQDGAALRRWDCAAPGGLPCLGSRVIDAGDLDGDGTSELVTIEIAFGSPAPMRIFGLDVDSGELLFEESVPSFQGAYSNFQRLAAAPDLDTTGFPTFALHDQLQDTVSIRRLAPELGKVVCSQGTASPRLRALGDASASADRCLFAIDGGPPTHAFVILRGAPSPPTPTFGATLCAGPQLEVVGFGLTDAQGIATQWLALSRSSGIGRTLAYQALFRPIHAGSLETTNAIQLRLRP